MAAASRAEPHALTVDALTVDALSADAGTVVGYPVRNSGRAHLASAGDDFAIMRQDDASPLISATAPFRERFAFEEPALQAQSSLQDSVAFDDRAGAERPASREPVRSAPAAARTTVARVAAPRPAVRAVAATTAPKRAPKAGFQLASASEMPLALGYAPADPAAGSGMTGALKELVPKDPIPKDSDPLADVDTSRTAIYDISSRTVYLPNGRRLEAHSGLGHHMDDPRSVAMKDVGATPPNVYDLRMRESLFHGVRAIRLIPKDDSRMYGRSGILAHSYMLGPNGQSNGCVSFSDYQAFLDAHLRGEVTSLVVVEHLAGAPKPVADWLSNTLRGIFQRS